MSDYKYDTEYLAVGDTFEGGPIEQSYFISAVLAASGEVEIDGNKVIILQLPKKEVPEAKAPVSIVQEVKAPEVTVSEVKAPEVQTPDLIEDPPLVDLASEEAVVEPSPTPAPIFKTRKPKSTPVKGSTDSGKE